MAEEGIGASKLGEAHVEVRAPTTALQKDLQRARKDTEAATGGMKKGFKDVDTAVVQSTRALLGLRGTIGTIIAIPLIQHLVGQFRQMADAVEDIGIKARTVGLSASEFQKLTYAARQADVSTEELNTALAFFAKGLGQAQAGVGPMVETLKRIDPELAKQIKTAKNMQEALNIAADAVESLSNAEDRAAVVTNLFGRSGIGMARLFGSGAEALRKFGNEAERAGQVLSDSDIEKGGKLSDSFTEAAAAINVSFKRALIEIAPILVKTIDLITQLATVLNDTSEAGRNSRISAAKSNIDRLNEEVLQLEERLANAQAATGMSGAIQRFATGGTEQQIQSRLKQIEELRNRIIELSKPESTPKSDKLDPNAKPGRRLAPTVDPKELSEAQQKLRDFREKYLQETEQFSLLAQQQFDNELLRFKEMLDKKLISEEEFTEVRIKMADLTARKMKEAFEKEFKDLLEAGRTVASDLESAFGQWVETGKFDVREMVRSMLVDLAKLQFRKGVIEPLVGGGSSPGGGLLGSLFSGQGFKFHGGGKVGSGGQPIMINPALWASAPRLHDGLMPDEYRAVLQKGETVIPKGQSIAGTKVEVHNYSGAPVREEQSNEGGVDIRKIIIGTVNEAMGAGKFDTPMRGRYGGRVQTRKT